MTNNINKEKASPKKRITSSVISLSVGIVLTASLILSSVPTIFNQVSTAQIAVPNINNINNQLAALTQTSSTSSTSTTTVFLPIPTASVFATITTPFLSIAGQVPLIKGSSTNGFISFLCASNSGLPTPNPSALSFQVSSSSVSRINPILTATSIPLIGSFILSNSLGVPSVAGQINTGQVSGNNFILQGALTNIGSTSGGISDFCNAATISPSLLPAFNNFAITGTCGTNVPVAFTVDRIVVGAFTANISCNNIT